MLNIDEFCKDAAKTLVLLATTFPRPHHVFVEDIYQAEETDEYGLHSERYLACFHTFLWLAEEGFLRFVTTVRNDAIEQAVLTADCLTLLVTPHTETQLDAVAIDRDTRLNALKESLAARDSTAVRIQLIALLNAMRQR